MLRMCAQAHTFACWVHKYVLFSLWDNATFHSVCVSMLQSLPPSFSFYNGVQNWLQVKAAIPLRRAGTAAEAAAAIVMLCLPYASYVTGQVLEVNGGAFM